MAAPNTVVFYDQENYKGNKDVFKVGDLRHIPTGGPLNKKWHSIQMGAGASLLTWNHTNGTGAVEWTASKPSLDGTDNYECFSVLETDATFIIGVKFEDSTGPPDGQYSLLVKAVDIGDVTLLSNEDDNFNPVGTMPTTGAIVTTAIYVRDLKTGVYIAQGSIYFGLEGNKVVIKDETNWPTQLRHDQDGDSNFIITLVSTS